MEVGLHALHMVLLEPGGRGAYRVVNFRREPIVPFCKLNSPLMVQALRAGLNKLAGNARNLDVWAGLTVDHVRIHHLTLPQMRPNHLSQGVYWAVQREESFSDEETVFDFEVEKEVHRDGRKDMAVTGFLLPREDRQALARVFADAGYPLAGMTLPLYAMRNFFRSGWLPATGDTRIFSHIGAQSSRIGIWADGQSILTRGIPIGLEQVTQELVGVLRPVPDRASALRMILNLGRDRWEDYDYDQDEVFSVIQPTLERMARQIDRTLEYYQTHFRDRDPVQCVHLSGGITESPRCIEYVREQIAVPLEVIDPFGQETETAGVSIPVDAHDRYAYATAFGLALSSASYSPNFLHTFKDRQREATHRRIKNRIFVLFFILTLVLGGYYAYQGSVLTELRAEKNRIQSELQGEAPLLDPQDVLTQLTELQGDFHRLVEAIDHHRTTAVLTELSSRTPEAIGLQSVSAYLRDSGEAEADAEEQAPWVRVSGILSGDEDLFETDLSLYVRRLESSPLFSNVTILESNSRQSSENSDSPVLHFALELSLVAGRRQET